MFAHCNDLAVLLDGAFGGQAPGLVLDDASAAGGADTSAQLGLVEAAAYDEHARRIAKYYANLGN